MQTYHDHCPDNCPNSWDATDAHDARLGRVFAGIQGNCWRPRPESNRGARICSPLRHHSALVATLGVAPSGKCRFAAPAQNRISGTKSGTKENVGSDNSLRGMVGAAGFELATPCSQRQVKSLLSRSFCFAVGAQKSPMKCGSVCRFAKLFSRHQSRQCALAPLRSRIQPARYTPGAAVSAHRPKNSTFGQKSGGTGSPSEHSSQLRHSHSWQQEIQLVRASYQAAPLSTRAATAGLTPTSPIMRSINST